MARILISWIGGTDLGAPQQHKETGIGPLAQALADRQFDKVALLSNYPKEKVTPYLSLAGHTNTFSH